MLRLYTLLGDEKMAYKIVYSTAQNHTAKKMYKSLGFIIIGVLCGIGLLYLRDVLVGRVLPDAGALEQLAQMVVERESNIAEAIAAFCRDSVFYEST